MAVVENNIQMRGKDSSDNDVLMYPITKAENVVGVMPIKNGGTGASTAEEALTNLGITATADELNKLAGSIPRASKDLRVTALADATVTVTNGDETYSVVADSDGIATFEDLTTGTWSVTVTNDTQTVTRTVVVEPDCSAEIHFFEAYINHTYPAGWTCTYSNGDTTLTAPDTSGSCIIAIHTPGDWVIKCTFDIYTMTSKAITIDIDGEYYDYSTTVGTTVFGDGTFKKTMSARTITIGDGTHTSATSATYSISNNIATIYSGNTSSSANAVGCLGMNNSFDLRIYSKVRVVVTGLSYVGTNYPRIMMVSYPQGIAENITVAQALIPCEGTYEIDVSNINYPAAYLVILLPANGKNTYIQISQLRVTSY